MTYTLTRTEFKDCIRQGLLRQTELSHNEVRSLQEVARTATSFDGWTNCPLDQAGISWTWSLRYSTFYAPFDRAVMDYLGKQWNGDTVEVVG